MADGRIVKPAPHRCDLPSGGERGAVWECDECLHWWRCTVSNDFGYRWLRVGFFEYHWLRIVKGYR